MSRTDGDVVPVRRLWTRFEPVHAVTYFAPEARAAFEHAGLRGFWRGYFAGRAAPLGAVGAAPVTALFCGFAPAMVARAVPDVWSRATPEQAIAAREQGAEASLRRLLGDIDPAAAAAADICAEVVQGLDCSGRPLAAANAELQLGDAPLLRLWQATTVLREHRGDGHVTALVGAGLDGCEALVLRAGCDLDRTVLQPARGWTDAEWDAAVTRLVEKGLVSRDGSATEAGRSLVRQVEELTDALAAPPWRHPGGKAIDRLTDLLVPIASSAAAGLPYPNPIGLLAR